MKITPTQLTIHQLFNSENEQFSIPAYQRRYAWTGKQSVELFEDINLLDKYDSHFLGTILLLTESHHANINVLEVVDGQQRIIALSLLMKAIKDKFIELGKEDIANEVDRYLYCQGLDRKKQNKIILGDLDEPDFSKVLQLKSLEEVKNQKLLNTYNEFKKWISDYDFNKLHEYYFKAKNNVIIVRLDTEKAKDAYKLFETINNRGLKLSPTDIIKNFLLGHASLISPEILSEVREYWKDLIVSLDGIDSDDFFRQYLMGLLGRKVTSLKLIYEFKKHYLTTVEEADILPEFHLFKEFVEYESDEENYSSENGESEESKDNLVVQTGKKVSKISISNFAKSLKYSAATYGKIINRIFDDKNINQRLYNLQRIESKPAYTFLLRLFQRAIDNKEAIQILKLIESFMLRFHICKRRTSELDDIFSKLADIKGANIINYVRTNLTNDFPSDSEFENKFASHIFKKEVDRAKYVLEQFEYYLINDQGEYIINSGNEVHLEHIIPQTINTKKALKEYGDWVSYLGKDSLTKHEQYVDRIGNYSLLAQKLNIKASNNPFLAKKKEYKKSNIRLTQKIAEEYSSFRFKQVDKRSANFLKLAVKIWSL